MFKIQTSFWQQKFRKMVSMWTSLPPSYKLTNNVRKVQVRTEVIGRDKYKKHAKPLKSQKHHTIHGALPFIHQLRNLWQSEIRVYNRSVNTRKHDKSPKLVSGPGMGIDKSNSLTYTHIHRYTILKNLIIYPNDFYKYILSEWQIW